MFAKKICPKKEKLYILTMPFKYVTCKSSHSGSVPEDSAS